MPEPRVINVGANKVGIHGLDEVLAELAPTHAGHTDEEVGGEILRRLAGRNYIPAKAREKYALAFAREFRKFLGLCHAEDPAQGLEIKVAGLGCPRCEELTNRVMRVLSGLGLPAALEHVRDPKQIGRMGVTVPPGLIINNNVVSVGRVLTESQIEDLLKQIMQNTDKKER